MNNGWTGGQYSVFRVIFGAVLCVHFVLLFSDQGVPPAPLGESPLPVTILLVIASAASILFVIGWHDRPASVLIGVAAACLVGLGRLNLNPGMLLVGWLLLCHCCVPAAPYGSLAARGRLDPGNSWQMPGPIYAASWFVMTLAYAYSSYGKLVSPSGMDGPSLARLALEVLFVALVPFRRWRPWLWGLMLLGHFLLIDSAGLGFGIVLLHFFTFDPAWVGPLAVSSSGEAQTMERIFYDAHCGLCHRAVRFVLAEDRTGDAFRFAPLDGDTFRASVAEENRPALPDTVVVQTADGKLLGRAAAVLQIMRRLGGLWRLLAGLLRIVPLALLDRVYNGIARFRHRLFARPEELCPIMPKALQGRFDH